MTRTIGRMTLWVQPGPSTKVVGRRVIKRGPYGSWAFTWPFGWFTLQVWRRYPNERLRCERCGYRKNDT